MLDVLQAQSELTRARANREKAEDDYIASIIELSLAVGQVPQAAR